MRNVLSGLAGLLAPDKATKKLSKTLSPAGDNLWLVEDVISAGQELVETSGLNIGDYVLHEDRRLLNNLGPVEITTAAV